MTAVLRVRLLRPGAQPPERQTAQASGFDLRVCTADGDSVVVGAAPVMVPTGIAIETPDGVDLQIRPRSGLSSRGVIAVPGTVDADYRGELFVTMYCLPSAGAARFRNGDRIAQLVAGRFEPAAIEIADSLGDTERGAGGHGSTGMR